MTLKPREAEICGWVEQGRSDAWIGKKLGTSAGSLQSFRFNNSIPRRPTLGEDELARVRAWVVEGKSHAGIGERLRKTVVAVVSLCSRNGIASPTASAQETCIRPCCPSRREPLAKLSEKGAPPSALGL